MVHVGTIQARLRTPSAFYYQAAEFLRKKKSSPVDIAGMTVESEHVFRCPECSTN